MTSPSLKIDTSVAQVPHPSYAESKNGGHASSSARSFPDQSPLEPSSSPATSPLTMLSVTTSSPNASTSSLLLPQASSLESETTVDTYISADLMSHELPQPEYVLAMHDYIPEQRNATCLAFRAGQVIRVLNRDPSGWWDGELEGSRGWFPSNYVNGDLALLAEEHLPRSGSVRNIYLSYFIYLFLFGNWTHLCLAAEANTAFTIPFAYLIQFHR